MASETEGIALLSMYGDDEEDEEAPGSAAKLEAVAAAPAEEDDGGEYSEELLKANHYKSDQLQQAVTVKSPLTLTSPSPVRSFDGSEFKTLRSPFLHQTPTPQPPVLRSQLSSPLSLTPTSPITAPVPPSAAQGYSEGQRARKTALAIVDYAQDETAMSPEAEFMEVEAYGLVVLGAEFASDWNTEGTAPVTSQSLTPTSQQERLLPVDFHKQSKFESSVTMNFNVTESEAGIVEASSTVSTDMQIDNLMLNFLPPPVSTKCPEVLQEKINKFLAYKRAGKSFNADLRNRKDYRNPNFLQHAVSYQDIDEIGTCFSKEVFDPHGYDKCDYYDELEADLKRELERKEQERKKSQKIEFVSGCTQTSGAAPALKTNTHHPSGSSLLSSSLPPNPATGDTAKESRINKKSKWDKVDGEPKIPLPSGGHDNQHSASVNASHLSAANAGTGYSAFAQLKRREAEERKSSDKKFDKRSS